MAARRDPRNHQAIVAVARDDHEAARLRGLLALGLQASPGVVNVLEEILSDLRERTSPAGLCAAYALGSLPPDHAPAVTARILTSFLDSNWKRQSGALLALLYGMSQNEQHNQVYALRDLYRQRANRNPAVRAALLELLLLKA